MEDKVLTSKNLKKVLSSKMSFLSRSKEIDPKITVVRSWDILHNIVINTAFILSPFSKQKTRPPYSPILFGVNVDTVMPENTA